MEAFYEGEEKGEDDRKEKGKEVKPAGWAVGEITSHILRTRSSKPPEGTTSVSMSMGGSSVGKNVLNFITIKKSKSESKRARSRADRKQGTI